VALDIRDIRSNGFNLSGARTPDFELKRQRVRGYGHGRPTGFKPTATLCVFKTMSLPRGSYALDGMYSGGPSDEIDVTAQLGTRRRYDRRETVRMGEPKRRKREAFFATARSDQRSGRGATLEGRPDADDRVDAMIAAWSADRHSRRVFRRRVRNERG